MFAAVYAAEGSAPGILAAVAREFSPRIETCGPREVLLDLSGLARLFGEARTIAEELRRSAADRGLLVRVAIAGTRTAARLLAHHRAGLTVIDPGAEADTLAPLPIGLLAVMTNAGTDAVTNPSYAARSERRTSNVPNAPNVPNVPNELLATLRRWGLRTLGEFAALPPDDVAARLGQDGVRWQRLAAGADPRPLRPEVPDELFEQALDLEWPIEGLEPLAFVLGRLMEPLSAHLERRDRGAAVLHVRLHLVTRDIHERSLDLPTPIRDAWTLRTLALLDLESHPPAAAIDRVVVAVDPTPGRVLQFSLLTRPLPSPEQISTLMARLHALMGQGRCGSPAEVEAWQPGAFAMKTFGPSEGNDGHLHKPQRHRDTENTVFKDCGRPLRPDEEKAVHDLCDSVPLWPVGVNHVTNLPIMALRRFRLPVPARVRLEAAKPARVLTDRRGVSGGTVDTCAGPWRTSGGWWAGNHVRCEDGQFEHLKDRDHDLLKSSNYQYLHPPITQAWDHDEWDVTFTDGITYRLFRERNTGAWFIDGIVD